MDLELLLAHADDTRPVLEGGLPLESAAAGATAERDGPTIVPFLPEGDPNDLTLQRWAIVAPEGPDGDRLLDLVEPLRKLRQEQQGVPVHTFRVPDGLDMTAAMKWKNRVYRSESVPEDERPLYMLLLGDIDRASLELQMVLASDLLVGRLACPSDEGYASYVDKVLRWERTPSPETQASSLFFTARDGTAATTIGHRSLVAPSVDRCRERRQKGKFEAKEIEEIAYDGPEEAKEALLTRLAVPDPTMLFTMSHGLGAPRAGWKSADEQRALQGAISMGGGMRITAEDVASRPFLPGGIWFFLACYGGGSPTSSAYSRWLRRLREAGGFGGRVESVLAGLPKKGDRPFIAALPQAALANPQGPLALTAHVDLAWTYSFQDMNERGEGRPSRFQGIFRSMVNGSRAGVSYNTLLRYLSDANHQLTVKLDEEERLTEEGTPLEADAAKQKANLWMLRQDLAGYLLLGDPAVRLPLTRTEAAEKSKPAPAEVRATPAPAPAAEPAAARAPARDARTMEKAVHEMIRGETPPKKIASEHGITLDELRKWEDVYCDAGRDALAKLR